jgi:hypothetical protein
MENPNVTLFMGFADFYEKYRPTAQGEFDCRSLSRFAMVSIGILFHSKICEIGGICGFNFGI